MSSRLPSREQLIELLRQNQCSPNIISHCEAVADLALETAGKLEKKGLKIDFELVQAGALLHDFGRCKTHTVDHAVVGAKMAESAGLPASVVSIIKRHVGGGITEDEAQKFGWPQDVYVPISLEEKVVSYADKLIEQSKRVPVELAIKQLQREDKNEAAQRVRNLHEEITILLEDKP